MINILLLHLIKVTNILELTLKMIPWISIEMQVNRVRVTIGGDLVLISWPNIIQMTVKDKHRHSPRITRSTNCTSFTDNQAPGNPADQGDLASKVDS
jgi:hypothetical protein